MKQELKKATVNNKLACKRAWELADKLDIPRRELGKLCNEAEIKIAACQLGCFK